MLTDTSLKNGKVGRRANTPSGPESDEARRLVIATSPASLDPTHRQGCTSARSATARSQQTKDSGSTRSPDQSNVIRFSSTWP